MRQHPFLDRAGPLAMAHRGGALEAAENTRAGFRHAVDLGYTYLESDVQVTRDGIPVLFHDDVLDRVTDGTGRVSELLWADLRAVGTPAGTDQIMRLDSALEEFAEQRFNLDLKCDAAVDATLAVLQESRAHDRVLLGSFSDRRLAMARRRVGPALATSAGPREVAAFVAAAHGLPMPRLPRPPHAPLALQIPVSLHRAPVLSRRLLDLAHSRGVEVHVWTVDEAPDMVRLLDMGVDGILTDRPALLRRVLEDRGQWHASTERSEEQ